MNPFIPHLQKYIVSIIGSVLGASYLDGSGCCILLLLAAMPLHPDQFTLWAAFWPMNFCTGWHLLITNKNRGMLCCCHRHWCHPRWCKTCCHQSFVAPLASASSGKTCPNHLFMAFPSWQIPYYTMSHQCLF